MPDPLPLDQYRARLIQDAERILGDQPQAAAWLRTPKIALQGQTPGTAMATEVGCHKSKSFSLKSGTDSWKRAYPVSTDKERKIPLAGGLRWKSCGAAVF
jgi:hypothetical protein